MSTLREIIDENVREGKLYEKLDRNWMRCFACGHCCKIPDGQPGVCKVRYNRGGTLYVPWGYVGCMQCDPIEKKPFFHAYPGALAYSFGMLGCDLHCAYCQNWVTSQALRDPAAVVDPMRVAPAELVVDAIRQGGRVIVSTYNEPLITSEWAVAVFKEARAAGLVTGFVSNGNGTPQVLDYVRPWVDLYKVDLKSFDDCHYRQLGGRLHPILDTIRRLHEMGFWLEIVTLVHSGTFERIAKEAAKNNQKPVRPFVLYSFRHTFLTRLGQPGCDVWTLARIAGHSSIGISARYVHPSEDAVLDAISRLGGHKIGHNENQPAQLPVAKKAKTTVQ